MHLATLPHRRLVGSRGANIEDMVAALLTEDTDTSLKSRRLPTNTSMGRTATPADRLNSKVIAVCKADISVGRRVRPRKELSPPSRRPTPFGFLLAIKAPRPAKVSQSRSAPATAPA